MVTDNEMVRTPWMTPCPKCKTIYNKAPDGQEGFEEHCPDCTERD